MPGLASLEKKLRSSGFTIIALTRDSKKDKALQVAQKAGVEFPIVDGGTLPGVNIAGFPHYLLYNRDGELIKEQLGGDRDSPDSLSKEFHTAIDQAIGDMAAVLTVPVEDFKQKPIVALAKRASTGAGLGKVLTQLDEKLEGGSDAEKEEAEALKQKLVAYADRLKQVAEESKDSAPHRRLDILKQLAKEFRNHPIGEEADTAFQTLKADAVAMNEVEASRLLEKYQLASATEKPGILKKLQKKHPESKFTRQAETP